MSDSIRLLMFVSAFVVAFVVGSTALPSAVGLVSVALIFGAFLP